MSRSRFRLDQVSLRAVAGVLFFYCAACTPEQVHLDVATAALEACVRSRPDDVAAWNRLADARLRLLGSTGNPAHLARAAEAVERSLAIALPAHNRGALALRVRVRLASHRFAEARSDAEEWCALLPDRPAPLEHLGDAHFAIGDYAAAERAWDNAIAKGGSPLAMEPRLAQLDLVHGRVERAGERLKAALAHAESGESPLADAAVACRVRLGEMAFRAGDWEGAEAHYAAALTREPGDYGALEHMAELHGAQGRMDEATALYTRLIAATQRPELMQALGDLRLSAGDARAAREWHARAEAACLASVKRGEVCYFHHLATFYTDARQEPEKAVAWARRDLTIRGGIHACDALAWALYKAGKLPEAIDFTAKALATGTRDAHILYHAGMIRMSAGDITGGTAALQQARAANPRFQAFHVHR